MVGSTVLITGACGFIGSHLAEYCVKKGHRVIAFDRYNPDGYWGNLEGSECLDDMEIVLGDIRDLDSVQPCVVRADYVFHLAALGGIPYSYVSPLAYVRTNIEGTYNVLQAARANSNLQQLMITSTSEVYGTPAFVPISEGAAIRAQSPYAATKVAADELALSYFRSFETPISIARPFNTYGPRQSSRAIIPSILVQLLKGRDVSIGSTFPTRDLTYVSDTVRAMYLVGTDKNCLGHVFNSGHGKEISIGDLVTLIGDVMGVEVAIKADVNRYRPATSEVERLVCDAGRIGNLCGWSPKVSLREGLNKTAQWLNTEQARYKAGEYAI